MLLVQIYLNHFNSSSPIHLLVVFMFFSDMTLGYVSIYEMYFYNRILNPVAQATKASSILVKGSANLFFFHTTY